MDTTSEPKWDKDRIQKMIFDKIEESTHLDYKAAGALERSDRKKIDITKDVSSFANAAGGIIIYGVKEFSEEEKKHLPEDFSPIDGAEFSKEWLENVILDNISPKLEDFLVTPVRLDGLPNINPSIKCPSCYVVAIHQGATAYQAKDLLYYRRHNFKAAPMEDYQIRDVMNRRRHPKLDIKVRLIRTTHCSIRVFVQILNVGTVLPKQYGVRVHLPTIVDNSKLKHATELVIHEQGKLKFWRFDLVGKAPLFPQSDVILEEEFSILSNHATERVPEPTGDEIACALYAEDMEPIRCKISPVNALAGWV